MTTWFGELVEKMEHDPQYIAESHLLNLTETICIIHGGRRPKGLNGVLFWLIEWCANKLIWQAKEEA